MIIAQLHDDRDGVRRHVPEHLAGGAPEDPICQVIDDLPVRVLALDDTRYGYVDEPTAVALHHWTPHTGVVSHLSLVGSHERWLPDWAAAVTSSDPG